MISDESIPRGVITEKVVMTDIKDIDGMHELDDGALVSEYLIDIELKRTKGRVSRQEMLELAKLADSIRKQRDAAIAQLEVK